MCEVNFVSLVVAHFKKYSSLNKTVKSKFFQISRFLNSALYIDVAFGGECPKPQETILNTIEHVYLTYLKACHSLTFSLQDRI